MSQQQDKKTIDRFTAVSLVENNWNTQWVQWKYIQYPTFEKSAQDEEEEDFSMEQIFEKRVNHLEACLEHLTDKKPNDALDMKTRISHLLDYLCPMKPNEEAQMYVVEDDDFFDL